MKRSISPEPVSSEKSPKLVHHSPDDGGAGVSSHHLPVTSRDQHLSCLPRDPVPVTAARDRTQELKDAWDLLKPAINIILDDSFSFKSSGDICCSKVFAAVKRACFNDPRQVQRIFDLVKQECEPHVAATMLFLEKQSNDPSVFLPLVYECWLGFKKKMMFVSDLAMYHKLNDMTLWDVGQEIFHKQLSMAPQLQDQVIAGMLGLITDERLGKTDCNTSLLKNLMDMFYGLSLYVFDKTFLDSTSKFYSKEAEQVLQQSDISEYLEYVEGSLRAEEKKYDNHYVFFASCRIRLMKVLERQLLANHAGVFEEDFKVLMDEGRTRMDDLRRMYDLFSRADMVVYIDRALRSYILAKGDEARQEGSLHELHTRIHKIWDKCFNEDGLLDKTIRDCFDGLGLQVPGELSDQEEWEDSEQEQWDEEDI